MGRRVAGARFGTAVANVGDLNYDGAEGNLNSSHHRLKGIVLFTCTMGCSTYLVSEGDKFWSVNETLSK